MKSLFILFILNIFLISNTLGQCIIKGKITDKSGDVVIGAQIYLKANKTVGTITDIDGNYSLKINEVASIVVIISSIGYSPIEEVIKCNNGATIVKNYVLELSAKEISEVTVNGRAHKNNDAQLESIKRISSSTIDFISSETIKKTGDVNVGSAIARISGVSTTSGGIITVRGSGDRYLKTTINGSRIPTLDPYTNNIKLDMFPSSLIDNIIITKTERPDLPGDWAGAYISVETKDYPDKLSINLETSFGYNNQTTFKDIPSSEKSSTDWLGYDNGFRDFDHSKYVQYIKDDGSPETNYHYQEFVALGLRGFLDSLGVTKSNMINENSTDLYFKLGLVRLGLLAKAQLNDPVAFNNAMAKYNSLEYKGRAVDIINADAVNSEKSFPNTWYSTKRKAPMNFSQNISIGDQTKLFGKTLGYFLGFRYSSSIQYDPNSIGYRIGPSASPPFEKGNPSIDSLSQKASKETNGWSALINVAYKFNANNSISFMYMPNMTGVNNVKLVNYNYWDDQTFVTKNKIYQMYESRKQMVYQLKSEHFIPGPKLKIELNASYTKGNSSMPDFKMITNIDSTVVGSWNFPDYTTSGQIGTGRIFRYLSDNIFDSRISLEMPLDNKPDLTRKLKIGASYLNDKTQRDQYYYELTPGNTIYSPVIQNLYPNADPYGPDRFDIVSIQQIGSSDSIRAAQNSYTIYDSPANHTFGINNIKAGYFMVDYSIIRALRLSGGLRVEQAHIFGDCNIFHDYNIPTNDERRITSGGPSVNDILANPSEINEVSYLPSANLIIKLNHAETTPVDIRLNYSQTVARPNFREISNYASYDYELNAVVVGNDSLKTVQIRNYDIGFESYFKSGDNISISAFYKKFINHIEIYESSNDFYWKNNNLPAWLEGIEIEGKKLIGNWFEFRANITFIDSRSRSNKESVDTSGIIKNETISNKMLGQAPYIINAMITYNLNKLGLTASLNYNVQGPRLVIIAKSALLPDIYELPRNLLDFKIIKTLGKHFGVSLKVQDILNSPIVRAYKVGNKYPLEFDRYQYGTNYVAALFYKF